MSCAQGSQFRFLYRNWCSIIVIPPFNGWAGAGPVLGTRGLYRLHHWLVDGKNTLVVGGGDANIAFINGNCIGPDGGFSLEAERVCALNLARMHNLQPKS